MNSSYHRHIEAIIHRSMGAWWATLEPVVERLTEREAEALLRVLQSTKADGMDEVKAAHRRMGGWR